MARSTPRETTFSASRAQNVLHFDVDSALLLELGEDLVTKRSVAMGELIKNAYDADATKVIVEFKKVSSKGGEISILDDGTGMAFSRIQDTWMRIATRDKAANPVSEVYGRARAGAKGIGRFATHRLAEELEMVSTAWVNPKRRNLGKEEVSVSFRWKEFKPGMDIQDVPVSYGRRRVDDGEPTGVLLRLGNVRDAWSADDVRELRKDLFRLISPIEAATRKRPGAEERDPGFDVLFEFPDEELGEYSGSLAEDFLGQAYAALEGTLTKDGRPEYTVRFRDSHPNKKPDRFQPPESRFPNVGKCRLKASFFSYKSDHFAGMELNVRDAQRMGREFGGIQIHYDGFRIPPYGDRGDDWLKLDYDRARRIVDTPRELKRLGGSAERPMLLLPGNNQLFGQVALSRSTNPDLHQLASREGLRENVAFRELRDFLRLGINWLTVMYARHSQEKRREEREAKVQEEKTPTRLLTRARAAIESLPDEVSPAQRKEAFQAIDLAIDTIEEQEAEHIGELQMLRVLASTGTMIVVFDHQLLGILQGLRDSYGKLRAFTKSLPRGEQESFGDTLRKLEGWIEDARHQTELLGLLLGTRARTRKRRLAIRPVVDRLIDAFSHYFADHHIVLENEVPRTLRTPPLFECELTAIVINLLTNALKAVRLTQDRRICMGGYSERKSLVIQVKDSGKGTDPARWRDYFRPFVSDSEPDPMLGTGTGLGLKIVADFVDVYGGSAEFVQPEPPWKTCVQVRLPES